MDMPVGDRNIKWYLHVDAKIFPLVVLGYNGPLGFFLTVWDQHWVIWKWLNCDERVYLGNYEHHLLILGILAYNNNDKKKLWAVLRW